MAQSDAAVVPAPGAPAEDDSMMASVQAAASSTWERISDMQAWRGPSHWRALASPLTYHWRPSDEHSEVYALGLERQYDDRWLLGGAYFNNSFGQPSVYAYLGRRHYDLFGQPSVFFQWSAGLMYGYVGKYKNKVPMNFYGFSPGALIGLGWQANRDWSFTLHALGDAAVMLQIAYDIH
jgi:hypothetical protein